MPQQERKLTRRHVNGDGAQTSRTNRGQRGGWRPAARRAVVIALCAVLPLFQIGCASKEVQQRLFDNAGDESYLRQTARAPRGTIGVVTARFVPDADFPGLRTGSGLTPGGGAAAGAAGGAALWGIVLVATGCLNPFAGATCPAVLPFAAGGAAVGAAAGAGERGAQTPMTAADASAAVTAAFEALDLQQHVVDRAMAYAQRMTRQTLVAAPAEGPARLDQNPGYSALRKEGIDTVLEISVLKVGMFGAGQLKSPGGLAGPAYTLVMIARGRLLRVSDAAVLHDRRYAFISVPLTTETWAENNAEALRRNLNAGLQDLVEQIVDRLFLAYDPPGFPELLWGKDACVAAPLSPVYPARSWAMCAGCSAFAGWQFAEVDSLQPTLRWQAFPTSKILDADQGGELQGLADVSYDFRVYDAIEFFASPEAQGWRPGDLAHSGTVEVPQYTPESPLKACSNYYLTFRTRFTLNGLPRVTQWAGLHEPTYQCLISGETWFKPSANYFPFRTPCPETSD